MSYGVLLVHLALFFGCQSAAEKQLAALQRDQSSLAELGKINNSIAVRSILPDQFSALKALREKYPQAPEVRQAYKNALVIREDWAALEELLTETPFEDLTPEDRLTLGRVYVKAGKWEHAVEVLERLVEAAPQDVEPRSLLGMSLFYLGRLDEAGAQFDAVRTKIESEKRAEDMTMRGLIYLRQNDLTRAVTTLTKALELDPSSAPASNALSQAFARSGDLARADEYRAKTDDLKKRAAEQEARARQHVQMVYSIENAWQRKNYPEVIGLSERLLATTTEKNKRLALYQYLFESHRALGNSAEAERAQSAARQLQQEK